MSVTLTAEQFAALLEKSTSSKKKITKTELAKRTEAMNIDEFINGMKFLNVSKLLTMELPDYITATIMENLSSIEDEELPFVCSNAQTKSFYFKENNEWVKGTDFMKKIYNVIWKNSAKQLMNSKYTDNSSENETDDDMIEKMYSSSRDSEKQKILCRLCDCDKYPYEKCVEKCLSKLAKSLNQ